jgi:hypothetical protein
MIGRMYCAAISNSARNVGQETVRADTGTRTARPQRDVSRGQFVRSAHCGRAVRAPSITLNRLLSVSSKRNQKVKRLPGGRWTLFRVGQSCVVRV